LVLSVVERKKGEEFGLEFIVKEREIF